MTSIRGTVKSSLTGDVLKGYKVYFSTHINQQESNSITTTDTNGIFRFENTSIHENSLFVYSLAVLNSKHTVGYPGTIPSESEIYIDKSNIRTDYILKTSPLIDYLTVRLNPLSSIIYPDSISIDFKHELYGPNHQTGDFRRTINSDELRGNGWPSLSAKPMGLWRINILKVKNGVTTYSTDSIFINFDEAKSYTLSF